MSQTASPTHTATPAVADGLPGAAWRAFGLFTVLALLSAMLVVGGNLYGARLLQANLSSSTEPLQIIVGNDVLHVPQNMIRHDSQRMAGLADKLDLLVHWPERSGYQPELAEAFAETDPQNVEMVLISIARRQWLLDMATRHEPVYRKAIDEDADARLVDGLRHVRLKEALGYIDETLVYAPATAFEARPSFIARCHAPRSSANPLLLACETDLFFAEGLEARVRFPASFLAEWRAFGPELRAFLEELAAPER